MNKRLFCILFNRAKGTWIVARESALGKGAVRYCGCIPMLIGCVGAATALHPPLQAQVVAARDAPAANRPMVTATANQTPLVQITTPNAAGVSSNHYTQFNVDGRGVILNNTTDLARTTRGEWVAGNPALAGGGAQVILNQVVGTSPSLLAGYIEVAGQRADVIIANPNGIVCNGGGFINTNRAMLTTGSAILGANGSLDGFRVSGGQIQIGEKGLNARNIDQVDLIARSLRVNGQVWAKARLNVITGANQVAYADLGVRVLPGAPGKPDVSLDVGLLGGMYANKIQLIGTEAGLGVRSQGNLATQGGDFICTQQGRIQFTHRTTSAGNLNIESKEAIVNGGTLYAQGPAVLTSQQGIQNTGTLAARKDLTLRAASLDSTGVLGAGVDAQTQMAKAGNLDIATQGKLTATGHHTAGGHLTFTGASLMLAGAQTHVGGGMALTASGGGIEHKGASIQAQGPFTVKATGAVVNDQGHMVAKQVDIHAATLSNRSGAIDQDGQGDTRLGIAGVLDNTFGTVTSNAKDLFIQSSSLTNDQRGRIYHAGKGLLTIQTGRFSNTLGRVVTNGQAAISAGSLINDSGCLSAKGAAKLTAREDISNAKGSIEAGGALHLAGRSLTNDAGQIVAFNGGSLAITATAQLRNAAGPTATGAPGGMISAPGDASLHAGSLDNSGTILANRDLAVVTGQALVNRGALNARRELKINASSVQNLTGQIHAAKVVLVAAQVDNSNGDLAGDALSVTTGNLTNQGGKLIQQGAGPMTLAVATALVNTKGGLIKTSSPDLGLKLQIVDNSGGTIALEGKGTLSLRVGGGRGALANPAGTLASKGRMFIGAGSIDNRGGILSSKLPATLIANAGDILNGAVAGKAGSILVDQLTLNAGHGTLSNRGGTLEAVHGISVEAQSLDNAGGILNGTGAAVLSVTTNQVLGNEGGRISSKGQVNVACGSLENRKGTMRATTALNVQSRGKLVNDAGVLHTEGPLKVDAKAALSNVGGRIEAGKAGAAPTPLGVAAVTIDTSNGRIFNDSKGASHIVCTGPISNSNAAKTAGMGLIGGGGYVMITTPQLLNKQGGQLTSAADLTLQVAGSLDNAGGKLDAQGALTFTGPDATVSNVGGEIGAAGNVSFSLSALDNSNGTIGNTRRDVGSTHIDAAKALTNAHGKIASGQDLDLKASTLEGDGAIIGGRDAKISLGNTYEHSASNRIQVNRNLTVATPRHLFNHGTLNAPGLITLEGGAVTNDCNGLVDGNITNIRANGQIENRGRIFGGQIALKAKLIRNGHRKNLPSVVAAREWLSIVATDVENIHDSLLYSTGHLMILSPLHHSYYDRSMSERISNTGSTIQSERGNITICNFNIYNNNKEFISGQFQCSNSSDIIEFFLDQFQRSNSPENLVLIQPEHSTIKYRESSLTPTTGMDGIYGCWYLPSTASPGSETPIHVTNYTEYRVTRTTNRTEVMHSEPGKIRAGGTIELHGSNIVNDKSEMMAGNGIQCYGGSLDNRDAWGEIVVTDVGSARSTDTSWIGGGLFGGGGHRNRNWHDLGAYGPDVSRTSYPLGIWSVVTNTSVPSNGNPAGSLWIDNLPPPQIAGAKPPPNATVPLPGASATRAVIPATGAVTIRSALTGQPQTVGDAATPIPNLKLPTNQLYQIHTAPEHPCLVETDPKFLNHMVYQGSEYLLTRLPLAPGVTRQRLGDAFYETQVVSEQIHDLTGRMFLFRGTNNPNQEFVDLMHNGLTSAPTLKLQLGKALTNEQLDILKHDSVWLAQQKVSLPDGKSTPVLVPVVYLTRATATAAGPRPTGAVLSAPNIEVKLAGTLDNSATLLAQDHLSVKAQAIENKGTLRTTGADGDLSLAAKQKLASSGVIDGAKARVTLAAKGNVELKGTTHTTTGPTGSRTEVDQVAKVFAKTLDVKAGEDLAIGAAGIRTQGNAVLAAQKHLNIEPVSTGSSLKLGIDGRNQLDQRASSVVGSRIASGEHLTFQSGGDFKATAAHVTAEKQLGVKARGSVTLDSAHGTSHLAEDHYQEGHSTFSSFTHEAHAVQDTRKAVGTLFSAGKVDLASGKDMTVEGSGVVATGPVALKAGGKVHIQPATSTESTSHSSHTEESGLMSGGQLGFAIGTRSQTDQAAQHATTQSQIPSSIGSIHGSVSIESKGSTRVTGSAVLAAKNIDIKGKRVVLDSGVDRTERREAHEVKQTGLAVGLASEAVNAARGLAAHGEGIADSKGDARAQALHAMAAASRAETLADRAKPLQAAAPGKGAKGAAEALGVQVTASIGSSQNQCESTDRAKTHAGSTVHAGEKLKLTSTGGDIVSRGASLGARNLELDSARDIVLGSAVDTASSRSSNSSSSASLGASATLEDGGVGVTANAAAAQGQGATQGDTRTHQDTRVTAKANLQFQSRRDTVLHGAQAQAETVKGEVGRDLKIASQQDTFTHAGRQSSQGVGVSVPIVGATGSITADGSQSAASGDFRSVNQQSGIHAGDGGVQVKVKGRTELHGGVIASTAPAERNALDTGTLATSDLANHAKGSVSSSSHGINLATPSSPFQAAKAAAVAIASQGDAQHADASTTHSAIAPGTLNIRDEAKQKALTGKDAAHTVAEVRRDTGNTHRALARPDMAGLQASAEAERDLNGLAAEVALDYGKRVYDAVSTRKAQEAQKAAQTGPASKGGSAGTPQPQSKTDPQAVKKEAPLANAQASQKVTAPSTAVPVDKNGSKPTTGPVNGKENQGQPPQGKASVPGSTPPAPAAPAAASQSPAPALGGAPKLPAASATTLPSPTPTPAPKPSTSSSSPAAIPPTPTPASAAKLPAPTLAPATKPPTPAPVPTTKLPVPAPVPMTKPSAPTPVAVTKLPAPTPTPTTKPAGPVQVSASKHSAPAPVLATKASAPTPVAVTKPAAPVQVSAAKLPAPALATAIKLPAPIPVPPSAPAPASGQSEPRTKPGQAASGPEAPKGGIRAAVEKGVAKVGHFAAKADGALHKVETVVQEFKERNSSQAAGLERVTKDERPEKIAEMAEKNPVKAAMACGMADAIDKFILVPQGVAPLGGSAAGVSSTATPHNFSRSPKGLLDQMVLDAAQKGSGKVIIKSLKDPKFNGMEKWSYSEKSANGLHSEVHYVRDPKTGKLMDFKFVHHAETGK